MRPEEIAEREFLVGLRGYDKAEVRKFLTKVAEDYRSMWAGSLSDSNGTAPVGSETAESATATEGEAAAPAAPAAPIADAGTGTTSPEDWARMGEEVAAVLRTAHEQVAALKVRAQEEAAARERAVEAEANVVRVEAEKYDADLRSKAVAWAESRRAEADVDRAEAKQALANAQDAALALVADAEARANRMLAATEGRARARAEEVLETARGQLRELAKNKDEASQRLESAQTYVGQAIEAVQSAPTPELPESVDDLVEEQATASEDDEANSDSNS